MARDSIRKNEGKRGTSYTVVVDVAKEKTFNTKRDREIKQLASRFRYFRTDSGLRQQGVFSW